MTEKKQVLHSDGTLEPLKPRLIKNKLLSIGLPEQEAEKIKTRVAKKLNGLNVDTISTSTITSEVSSQLTSRGFMDIEKSNRILGATFKEIDNMINSHIKDNANMGDNTETLYKYIAELALKPYTLERLPDHIAQAHINGIIHIHDMADFFLKPNCLGYDLQTLIERGLSCDGDVGRTSRAGPAKHFEVFVQHMLQTLMSGKVDLSGGQAFHLFNIYLAPLTVDLTYEELKQSLQTFIFGCNMSCVSKGEVVFSSIGLHPACPDYLYDEPAMVYGGEYKGVYGDYEKESKRIFKIICELLEEGDYENRPFRFPNTICHLRDEYMDRIDDELFYFCKYLRRYPTGYFVNDDMENGGGIRAVMGCRTASNDLDDRFTWKENILNTGNLAFHTINLPLLALQSENIEEFYQRFDDCLNLVVESLILRRNVIKQRLEDGRLPFLMWGKKNGEPLYNIDTTTLSIGYCGLNECILELTDGEENSSTEKGMELGKDIIFKIVDKCKEAKKETGFKFGCFSTPAESTAHRFATINKEKYPNAYVNGTKDHYYLTNSHHINPGQEVDILKHIENANEFHSLANFGSILHIFISEVPDVDAFINLTRKIKEYNVGFWSYTLDFSICEDCGATILKAVDECPHCGSHNILTYSKITGYYTPIKNWNNGKLGEFDDRVRYAL
ncbi:MAG: anaerobic ribonucleoside-triphosphate reductase [Methanobrevibacter sp.]|nr:anaerobic ribonucleoside-triphosphate reductase [Methanobrevibacter sp.]